MHIDYWDNYFREQRRPIVTGLAIINQWISMMDAVPITYSFN